MTEPRIVSPEEAKETFNWIKGRSAILAPQVYDLAHTVATEPERTRAAVVKALRSLDLGGFTTADLAARGLADAIENGADY